MSNLTLTQNAVRNSQNELVNYQLQAAMGKRVTNPSQDIVTQAISDQMNFNINQGGFISTSMSIAVEKLNLINGRLAQVDTLIDNMITAANTANSAVADESMRANLQGNINVMSDGIRTILASEATFQGVATAAEVHTRNDTLSFVTLPSDFLLNNLSTPSENSPVGALNVSSDAKIDVTSPTQQTIKGFIGSDDVNLNFQLDGKNFQKPEMNEDVMLQNGVKVVDNQLSPASGAVSGQPTKVTGAKVELDNVATFSVGKAGFTAGVAGNARAFDPDQIAKVGPGTMIVEKFVVESNTSDLIIGTNNLQSITAKGNGDDLDVTLTINGTDYTGGKIANGYKGAAEIASAAITFTNASVVNDKIHFTLADTDKIQVDVNAKAFNLLEQISKFFVPGTTLSGVNASTNFSTLKTGTLDTTQNSFNLGGKEAVEATLFGLSSSTKSTTNGTVVIDSLNLTEAQRLKIGANNLQNITAKQNGDDLDVTLNVNGNNYTGTITNGYIGSSAIKSGSVVFTNNLLASDKITFNLADSASSVSTSQRAFDLVQGIADFFTGQKNSNLGNVTASSAFDAGATAALDISKNSFTITPTLGNSQDMTKVKFIGPAVSGTNTFQSLTLDLSNALQGKNLSEVWGNFQNVLNTMTLTSYPSLGTVTVKSADNSQELFTFNTALTGSEKDKQKLLQSISSIGIMKNTGVKANLSIENYNKWFENKGIKGNTFFKTFLDPNKTQGFVDGQVLDILISDIGVDSNGKKLTQITLKTDKETFSTNITKEDIQLGSSIVLEGSNNFNRIGLIANRSFLIPVESNASTNPKPLLFDNNDLQESLRQLFGTSTGSNAMLTPPSMSNNSINKALGGSTISTAPNNYIKNYTTVAGSGMSAGTYAFRYNYDEKTEKGMAYLTNGKTTLTTILDNATNTLDRYENPITFSNGFQIVPADGTVFDLTQDIGQFTMSISGISANPFNVQITLNGDMSQANFGPLNMDSLGLSKGLNLSDTKNVDETKRILELARKQIGTYKSNVYAQINSITSSNNALKNELQGYQAIEESNNGVDASDNFKQQSEARNMFNSANAYLLQMLLDTAKTAAKYQQAQAQTASVS